MINRELVCSRDEAFVIRGGGLAQCTLSSKV